MYVYVCVVTYVSLAIARLGRNSQAHARVAALLQHCYNTVTIVTGKTYTYVFISYSTVCRMGWLLGVRYSQEHYLRMSGICNCEIH